MSSTSSYTIIRTDQKAALIEWRDADGLHREIAPKEAVKNETYELGTGIPYGVRWSELSSLKTFPERLEQMLHTMNIWTWNDFENNPNEARTAFLRAGLQEMKKEARNE